MTPFWRGLNNIWSGAKNTKGSKKSQPPSEADLSRLPRPAVGRAVEGSAVPRGPKVGRRGPPPIFDIILLERPARMRAKSANRSFHNRTGSRSFSDVTVLGRKATLLLSVDQCNSSVARDPFAGTT